MDLNNFNKIERYLNDKMTEAEKTGFKNQMAEDAELKKEVLIQELENDVIRESAQAKLKAKLAAMHQEHLQSQPEKKTKTRSLIPMRILAAAASLLILIGAFFFFTQKPAKRTGEMIALSAYSEESLSSGVRSIPGSDTTQTVNLTDFLEGVNIGDIEKANIAIANLRKYKEPEVKYLIAHAYFLKKDFPKAAENFKKLAESDMEASLKEKADYFLLLAYIAQENREAAQKQKNKILDESIKKHRFNPKMKNLEIPN